jgi:hypothetical protein
MLPPAEQAQRRSSEASISGASMEARMARIEGMMEALVQKNGISITTRETMESGASRAEEYQYDGDAYAANLVPVHPQLGFPQERPESDQRDSISSPAAMHIDSPNTIRVGESNRAYPFPRPSAYQKYIDTYFREISPCVPCIDQAPFQAISEHMLSQSPIPASSIALLALQYIIFACVDILGDTDPFRGSTPRGWDWYQVADELVGTKWLAEGGNMRLIQFFLIKVCFPSWIQSVPSAITFHIRWNPRRTRVDIT